MTVDVVITAVSGSFLPQRQSGHRVVLVDSITITPAYPGGVKARRPHVEIRFVPSFALFAVGTDVQCSYYAMTC